MNELNYIIEYLDKRIENEKRKRYNPEYIKIPLWVYDKLHELYVSQLTYYDKKENFYYKGLKLCPTVKIKYLVDIEVF